MRKYKNNLKIVEKKLQYKPRYAAICFSLVEHQNHLGLKRREWRRRLATLYGDCILVVFPSSSSSPTTRRTSSTSSNTPSTTGWRIQGYLSGRGMDETISINESSPSATKTRSSIACRSLCQVGVYFSSTRCSFFIEWNQLMRQNWHYIR